MSTANGVQNRRIRLHRIGTVPNKEPPQEELIKKNLEPMLQHTEKKKRAQEAYYEKNGINIGVSPMMRDFKPPVRQRLGRRILFNGTNTSTIPPKNRLYKINSTLNNSISKRKVLRKNQAQLRLDRIRERHQQALNFNPTPKRIKLRRIIPNSGTLRVQVANNNSHLLSPDMVNHVSAPMRHRQILDSNLQRDIRQLQNGSQKCIEVFDNVRFRPMATATSMHFRFGELS